MVTISLFVLSLYDDELNLLPPEVQERSKGDVFLYWLQLIVYMMIKSRSELQRHHHSRKQKNCVGSGRVSSELLKLKYVTCTSTQYKYLVCYDFDKTQESKFDG